MPRASWLIDAARATGYPVVEVDGWEARGSTTFDPKVLVWHHTAGAATGDMPSLNLLINGRSDLPGPLSQYGLGRSGTIYLVAAGRANHAGLGGWAGYRGNASAIGIEAEHTGKSADPWPNVQLDSYRKLSREILQRLGVGVGNLCGHKEWAPDRKVDPISLNMTTERALVDALPQQEEEDVALTPKAENTAEYWVTALEAAGAGDFDGRKALIDKIVALTKAPAGTAITEAQVRALVADEMLKRISNG